MGDRQVSFDTPLPRRHVAQTVGLAGLSALTAFQLGPLAALAQSSESVAEIINIAATAEALAVSLTDAVMAGAHQYDRRKGLPPTLVRSAKAIQAEEYPHYQYLTKAGAQALTLKFTIPQNLAGITRESSALLSFLVEAETIFIGAHIAAARKFTTLGHPKLAQATFQICGMECEHRVHTRHGLGDAPPTLWTSKPHLSGR